MSAPFKNILVAFDGSKDSTKAVQTACSISSKYDSKLSIITVYRSPTAIVAGAPGMPIPDLSDIEDAAKEGAMGVLSRGVEIAAKEGVKAKGELMECSSTVEAIIYFAGEAGADLIVMGTRGMTGFKKLVMGSVSSGVVGHASCPVLVVR